jgi:hypothetical protein
MGEAKKKVNGEHGGGDGGDSKAASNPITGP